MSFDPSVIAPIKRIMLVDDEPDVCYILTMILKLNDLDVTPFTDPELALAHFGKGHFDLLLLDVKMPQMTGFELYKKMKKIDNQIRVCFMTNYRLEYMQEFRQSFPDLAASTFVSKPASGSDLISIIKEMRLVS